ncbi:hypothetical protein ULMS_13850 [Patiriisocius marinistellae]|uniref:Uncharacterized protein n=1 Tax=Patiriisocius marinistellae TaxID=2494560 RepID=A0A5J4FTM9_9FLAO|nr:hypothetical protein ULMS_13850 [Patiriisocius marinistellae]
MEPTAIVDAKSKLDIFAKVRSPETLVIMMMIVKIARTVNVTFKRIGNAAKIQFSIV